MNNRNKLKDKLKKGESVFGSWSMLASSSVMNVMGEAGLDFIIIDMEHGPMSFETAENQLYAAEAAGCTPIIRLGEVNELAILRTLEIGVQGILVSHVSNPAQAKQVVDAVKYYPEGKRGLSPFTRRHAYSEKNLHNKLQFANDQLFVGVLVEGEEGISNLSNIVKTPGLDMIYLGLYDISLSLGIPGELEHPQVLNRLKECVTLIKENNLIVGSVARDRQYLNLLFNLGVKFLAYRVDCAVLREGYELVKTWHEELKSECKTENYVLE